MGNEIVLKPGDPNTIRLLDANTIILHAARAMHSASIPFATAVTDRLTGVIYNIDNNSDGDIVLSLYSHKVGEFIYPPYPALQEPVINPPGIRVFVDNGVFGYELASTRINSDPINNHTIDRFDLYELGISDGWVFGDDLVWISRI